MAWEPLKRYLPIILIFIWALVLAWGFPLVLSDCGKWPNHSGGQSKQTGEPCMISFIPHRAGVILILKSQLVSICFQPLPMWFYARSWCRPSHGFSFYSMALFIRPSSPISPLAWKELPASLSVCLWSEKPVLSPEQNILATRALKSGMPRFLFTTMGKPR